MLRAFNGAFVEGISVHREKNANELEPELPLEKPSVRTSKEKSELRGRVGLKEVGGGHDDKA